MTMASKELCVDRKRRLDLDAVSAPLPARFLLSRCQGREVELGAAEDREAEQLEITNHMQEVEEEVIDWVSCIIFKRYYVQFLAVSGCFNEKSTGSAISVETKIFTGVTSATAAPRQTTIEFLVTSYEILCDCD